MSGVLSIHAAVLLRSFEKYDCVLASFANYVATGCVVIGMKELL